MIQHEQAVSGLSIEAMCEALDVSASGYYAWCERDSSPRQEADARLGDEIERVFTRSRHTYGSHRVWLALREQGIRTSRKRVERLMRQRGLRSIRIRKRRWGLTKIGQSAYFAPNLLQQDFAATGKNRGALPSPEAIRKLLWLAHQDIVKKWTMPVANWANILNQLAIRFEDRFPI